MSDGKASGAIGREYKAAVETKWQEVDLGRRAQQNIIRETSGPTPHKERHISKESVASAWHLFIN